jgi:hypothetical protein
VIKGAEEFFSIYQLFNYYIYYRLTFKELVSSYAISGSVPSALI